MNDCVFCRILKGKLPCYKVYENTDYMAFLDIKPFSRGHTLLIPKKHYRWTWDVADFGGYWEVARKVGLGIIAATKAYMVEFLTHGEDVAHAHILIVPIYKKGEVYINNKKTLKVSDTEMKTIAKNIKNNI